MPVAFSITSDFGKRSRLAGKDFTKKVIADAERKARNAARDIALDKFAAVTRTWDTPTTFWARKVKDGYTIWSDNKAVKWLDEGTEVRYASMNKGYVSKTRVGTLYSYRGSPNNRVMYVSRLVPRDGIEARNWSEKIDKLVAQKIRSVFVQELHTRWRA